MTDASAWRQISGNGADPSWWSQAQRDPWRDPQSPAVVIAEQPPAPADLEPLDALRQPRQRGPVGLAMLLSVAVVTALVAGALGGTLGYVFAVRAGSAGATALGNGEDTSTLTDRAPESIAALAEKVLPSVVTLRVSTGEGTSLGSGFIVSSSGYAVTNNHVVEGSTGTIAITFSDATTASASIVGSDPESDLAVIKIDKDGLSPVEFGDSDTVQVGDPVVAVGAPLALSNTVTYGIVSALDRPIRTADTSGGYRYYAAIQTDAAVNQGNSGGPLFDASGRVVGVNSVIGSLAEDQDHAGNVGLAFAIPINQTKRIAQDLIDTGKVTRTVIGAQIDDSYSAGGARLSSVESGGPAETAGLRVGDIVRKIGSGVVQDSWDLIAFIRKYSPGDTVSVEFTRNGVSQTLMVTLTADVN